MAETLYAIPPKITAGTTVSYTRTLADYPATAWTLTVSLNSLTTTASGTVTTSGSDYVVTFSATTTGALTAGEYRYSELVTKSGEVYEVGRGTVTVLPKVSGAVAGAVQSANEKLLAAIESVISGRITADVESYTVDGRSVAKIPIDRLRKIRGILKAAVYREQNPTAYISDVGISFPEGRS